jgi:triphosphoribosyl-dephospho-CoA synthase
VAPPLSPGTLSAVACALEATARKPGNVHRYRDFQGLGYLDLILSAQAVAPALDRAATEGVGRAVLEGVRATRRLVRTNTNLGMLLLLAPLAAVGPSTTLEQGVADILVATTVDDAVLVYEAIRLAEPGGLGRVEDQDVSTTPSATLLDVMRMAAGRDSVARQYDNRFADVLGVALPALRNSLLTGRTLEEAVILTHLTLLAHLPDTLIARKRGASEAEEASRLARELLAQGWPDRPTARLSCARFDCWLRSVGHERNPGTTADLVTAALFAGLRDGTIRLPIEPGRWSAVTDHQANP